MSDRVSAMAKAAGEDAEAVGDLARAALVEGREEAALPTVRAAAERTRSARLWQLVGLLERSLDEHELALASFDKAAALAPSDASIAHGRARVALEAGIAAVDLFQAALQLDPGNGEILLGHAAALFAEGRGEQAESALDLALANAPLWLQGHVQLAQLRAMLGKRVIATESVERALRTHPEQDQLWTTLFTILLQAHRFVELGEAVGRARSSGRPESLLRNYEAIAAAERGETERADTLFAALPNEGEALEIWRIRHLLRSGRVAEAVAAIDRQLGGERAPAFWPYAAAAWRLAGDPRRQWLEGDERLVSIIDLSNAIPDLGELERALRSLHLAKGEYLDQSVRGGSQTDGPLLSRIDPRIRALRSAIVGAVERYVDQLPPPDPKHPLLAPPRNRRIRFSGSWSVLLRGGGHHSNHVHPQGWISSAFYVALPPRSPGEDDKAGWLTLGEPQKEMGLDLPPFRYVEPKVGQLVLFPSWTWHGTIAFQEAERLTVAFDVRPPI